MAARIAQAASAQAVVLLSDVDGLYTADPTKTADAERIPEVRRIDARIRGMAQTDSSSGMGSGGMASKIEAARITNAAGAALIIVSGLHDHPLKRLAAGGCGTVFTGSSSGTARKAWLAGRLTVKGRIYVDGGAARALVSGASLLPAGAARVEGRFVRGDVVDIVAADGQPFARGLAEYDAEDASRICGKRTDVLADVLGYAPRAALVHRDHLVML